MKKNSREDIELYGGIVTGAFIARLVDQLIEDHFYPDEVNYFIKLAISCSVGIVIGITMTELIRKIRRHKRM